MTKETLIISAKLFQLLCELLKIDSIFLSDITAEICGVPVKFVSNLRDIYGALASGFDIAVDRFEALCKETEKLFFDHVGWFSLTPTLHRIFKHAAQVIEACPLPIGVTTEEASEANNKNVRRFRLHHARRNSWHNSISDLFNRMMDWSDPKIQATSASRRAKLHQKRRLPPQVLALLKEPEVSDSAMREPEANKSDLSDDESS